MNDGIWIEKQNNLLNKILINLMNQNNKFCT